MITDSNLLNRVRRKNGCHLPDTLFLATLTFCFNHDYVLNQLFFMMLNFQNFVIDVKFEKHRRQHI